MTNSPAARRPGGPALADQTLQGPNPGPAVAFVKGGLRFDEADHPGEGGHGDVDEAFQSLGIVVQAPGLEQAAGRIEADDQGAMHRAPGHGPVGERGHRHEGRPSRAVTTIPAGGRG